MKMTNLEIITVLNNLAKMQEREKSGNRVLFPGKIMVTYAIRRNKAALMDLIKPYEEERQELVSRYNKPDATKDNRVDIKEEFKRNWDDEMKQLLSIELDAEVSMINISELEGCSLSMDDMDAIAFMIQE